MLYYGHTNGRINRERNMFKFFKRLWSKLFGSEPEVENDGERDNIEEHHTPQPSPQPETEFQSERGEKLLYYPEAIRYKDSMKTRGKYSKRYPKGAVVHFTAGRGRKKAEGGSRAKDTHKEMGKKSVESAIRKGSYCYFVIDRDGGVHQPFSLDRWGYHAGESRWSGIGSSVSDEMVGIEIQAAGKVKSTGNGDYKAYYTSTSRGDKTFQENEVRHAKEDNDNIQKGTYHKYTEAQEEALMDLLLWLKHNNPDVFNFAYVAGHDEVAGMKGIGRNRKNDPGAALSMTMTELRQKLKERSK